MVEARLPRNFFALMQVVEYLRAFLMARLGLSEMQTLLIISGAFGLFRRNSVIDVGGFSADTVGEDMELVVKLHRRMRDLKRPYRIVYIPEPVSWTEAPETAAILGNQRARWQRGSLETFRTHKDMFLNPRYGRIGLVGFGQVWVVDVVGPIVEVAGYLLPCRRCGCLDLFRSTICWRFWRSSSPSGSSSASRRSSSRKCNCAVSRARAIWSFSPPSPCLKISAIGGSTISGGCAAGGSSSARSKAGGDMVRKGFQKS